MDLLLVEIGPQIVSHAQCLPWFPWSPVQGRQHTALTDLRDIACGCKIADHENNMKNQM